MTSSSSPESSMDGAGRQAVYLQLVQMLVGCCTSHVLLLSVLNMYLHLHREKKVAKRHEKKVPFKGKT